MFMFKKNSEIQFSTNEVRFQLELSWWLDKKSQERVFL